MKECEKVEPMDTKDMVNITDKVDLQAYIYHDKNRKEDLIVLRIFKDDFEGVGLNLPPYMSNVVLDELKKRNIDV